MPKVTTTRTIIGYMKMLKYCRTKRTKANDSLLPHDLVFLAFINQNPLITRYDLLRLHKANGGMHMHYTSVTNSVNRLYKWNYVTTTTNSQHIKLYTITAAGKAFLLGAERAIRAIKIDTIAMINYRLQKVKEYQRRKRQ
jgi:DNA-binding MarR family transcriptional regulator